MAKQKLDIDWDRLIRETEEIAESNRIRREEEIKSKPLFTLTAEEVELIETLLIELMEYHYFDRISDDLLADNLLTRIKQWQG